MGRNEYFEAVASRGLAIMLMIHWMGALVWREGAGHYIRDAAVPSGVEACHFGCMAVARRASLNKKDTDTLFDHYWKLGRTAVT